MKKQEEEIGGEKFWLGSLDVKDAFLQVDQATSNGHFEALKNLPGQRVGAEARYECITSWLEGNGFVFGKESPCLGRRNDDMMLLIHVDDIMFVGKESYVKEVFLPAIQSRFEISQQHIEKVDDQIQFLRRTCKLVSWSMPSSSPRKVCRQQSQQLLCGQEMLEPDGYTLGYRACWAISFFGWVRNLLEPGK